MDNRTDNENNPPSGFPITTKDNTDTSEAIDFDRAFKESNMPDLYLKAAKNAILLCSYNDRVGNIGADQLAVVWFCKVLQNWKALLCTTIDGDGLYFEVTYNGDRCEAYVDTYHKISNEAISNRSGQLNPRR